MALNVMDSIHYRLQTDHQHIVKVLAEHYIGNNPEIPFTSRVFNRSGILQNEAGQYDINFNERFSQVKQGSSALAAGLVWSDTERSIDLALQCYGPIRLYHQGELLYRSTAVDEVKQDHQVIIPIAFERGWNTLIVHAKQTTAGFGCALGADEAKVRILNVLAPFSERFGQAGWVYSEPFILQEPLDLPDLMGTAEESPLKWYPTIEWDEAQVKQSACERIFGIQPGQKAYAWSTLNIERQLRQPVMLRGQSDGPLTIWINHQEVVRHSTGSFEVVLELPPGSHDVVIETVCAKRWDWHIEAMSNGLALDWKSPIIVHGYDGAWLYLGPFAVETSFTTEQLQQPHRIFEDHYWQLDMPQSWVRPYYENALLSNAWTTSGLTNYARWDYPLGVTMYGLLRTGSLLKRDDISDYAIQHIKICTDYYDYARWDREQYGFPSLNQQLVLIKMLDNCGSFGSAMLQAYKQYPDEQFLKVADVIADFIKHQLERREDGAFYRICAGEYSEHSMWADDLYMSTPFMRRYYEISGDESILDDAVQQFILYKKYLFMSEDKIMSHVYDFKYDQATRVPWGRGNGWSIFSLSELLEVLPKEHAERPALLQFYNELCEGYLALQGERGLWRQVLNDPEAYEEASCTAMFVYAFARGVYNGWLNDPERFVAAALKGWEGLSKHAIDRQGNVYAVCSGSRYAFSADYYKEDLGTVVNDNHGIGIMMLAGVEICHLLNWLEDNKVVSI